MGRKNKTKILRNRANAELLDDTLRSREDGHDGDLKNSPAERVRHLLDILEKKENELMCSRRLIDHLKTQSTTSLEEKMQEASEREKALENDRNTILGQLDAFRNKFEDIKDSSSSNIVKLKEENEVLEGKLLNTTKQLEKYKKELGDLERQFVITNQLVSESQKSSEVVKEEFQKLIAEKSAALVDALKSADNYQKTCHVSAEELEKVRMKLAALERDKLEFSESQKHLEQVKIELEDVKSQKKLLEEKLNAAVKLSETNEKAVNEYRQGLDDKFIKITEEMERVKSDVIKVTSESEKVDIENQQLRKTIIELEKSLSRMEEESKNNQDVSKKCFESETKKIRDDYSRKVKSSNQKVNKLEKEVKKLLNEKVISTAEINKLSEEIKSKAGVVAKLDELAKIAEQSVEKVLELEQFKDRDQKTIVKLESRIAELQRSSENCQKRLENDLVSSEKMLLEATKKSEQQEQQIADVQSLMQKTMEQVKDQEKLENTVKTMEAQIEELKNEKVDAKNHLLRVEERSSSEMDRAKIELEELAGKNSELQTQLEKELGEVAELKKVGEKYKRKMEDKLAVVRSKLEKAEKLAKEEQEKCKQISALETKKIEVLEQMANTEKDSLKSTLDTANQVNEQLQRQVELMTAKLEERGNEHAKLLSDLQATKEKLEIVEKVAHEDKVECQRLAESESTFSGKLSILEKELSEKTLCIDQLQNEKDKHSAIIVSKDTTISSLENVIQDEKKKLELAEKSLEENEKNEKSLQERYSVLEKTLRSKEENIEKLMLELKESEKKSERQLELENELEKSLGKVLFVESETEKLKEEIKLVKSSNDELTNKRIEELEVEIREIIESKDKIIAENQANLANLGSRIEELGADKERARKLESRMEVLQQSAANRQKRLEEELSNTRQKLEEALKKQLETDKDNEKMADLESRIDILTSESIVEKNTILADLERVKNELAQSEEARETDAELVTKLQASLIEVRQCFEEEKNHLAAALESTQQKLTAADEAKTADSRMISQLENTVSALELALKTNVVEENQEIVKEENNSLGQNPLDDAPRLETNEDLMAFANSYYRQLHHRLELLRRNQSVAFYPYIRYLIAVYILLLHIWLLW